MTVEAPTMTAAESPQIPELRIADRCDHGQCGAQAFVITEHAGRHLFWCAHHYHSLEELLFAHLVRDERETINPKPSPSANAG